MSLKVLRSTLLSVFPASQIIIRPAYPFTEGTSGSLALELPLFTIGYELFTFRQQIGHAWKCLTITHNSCSVQSPKYVPSEGTSYVLKYLECQD